MQLMMSTLSRAPALQHALQKAQCGILNFKVGRKGLTLYRDDLGRTSITQVSTGTASVLIGVPGGIRTPGLLLRRQLLYPTKLQAHGQTTTKHHLKYILLHSFKHGFFQMIIKLDKNCHEHLIAVPLLRIATNERITYSSF